MTKENDLAGMRANLSDWLAAFNAKDSDALFALYDPESVYANAGAPLMRGVDEIKPWYIGAFDAVEGNLLYKEEAAFVEGSMGFLLGSYYFRPPAGVTPPADAQLTGRVVLVYRKNQDGNWKLLFDMDNTPPDVLPSHFAA